MKNVLIIFLLLLCFKADSQSRAYFDPAQGYNKLLLEKNGENGTFERIGNYKVIGTAYLFGGGQDGTVYIKQQTVSAKLSFDTYKQLLLIYAKNSADPYIKNPDEVDSFMITVKTLDFDRQLHFTSTNAIGLKGNFFLLNIFTNSRFNLYKKYFSALGIVTTNIVQAELRQFDLNYEYYYTDSTNKELKKLKLSVNGIKKEFRSIKDVSPAFGANDELTESKLVSLFEFLNQN